MIEKNDVNFENRIKTENDLEEILSLLRVRIHYDFRGYKRNTLRRRIERRMSLKDVVDTNDYRVLLRDNPNEINELLGDLLIGVTNFFREPEAWDHLGKKVIAPLIKKADPKEPLRIWVAGCSTGEEAYTVSILINEQMERLKKQIPLQIFATDLDENAINLAREGVYSADRIENHIQKELVDRYFTKRGTNYQIRRSIRDMMTFAVQNIITDPPFSRMDLLCCRNLLIYLETNIQERLTKIFHFSLKKDGYLFLGNSESVRMKNQLFETVFQKWRIYKKIGAQRPTRLLPLQTKMSKTSKLEIFPDPAVRPFESMTEHVLAKHFVSAAVLVDTQYQIRYFHGNTEQFLTFPQGEPTQDLLTLVRKGLHSRLQSALTKAKNEQVFVEFDAPIRSEKTAQPTRVTIMPAPEDGLFLVAFRAAGEPLDLDNLKIGPDEMIIQSLEDELRTTREELKKHIEEQVTANEELKTSNEEIMSMNEELQSINEELETSKEELQSVNEEMSTLNEQLKGKLKELEIANDDLDNLINSTDIATLFLDPELRLKRYTPKAIDLMNLIPSDIGRPLSDLVSLVPSNSLTENAAKVMKELQPTTDEVQADNGKWYLRRMLPYRTNRNTVEGLVITYSDVTEIKKAQQDLQNSEHKLNLATQAAGMGIHDYDPVTGELYWDERVRELWGIDPDVTVNYENFMEGIHPDDRRASQKAVDHAMEPDGDHIFHAEYRVINRKNGMERWVLATGQVFFVNRIAVRLIGTVHDITDQKKGESKLIDMKNHLERLVQERTLKLTEQTHRLKKLTWMLSNAEQRERRRLANLLHDNLQQLLVGAKLNLHLAKTQGEKQSDELLDKVSKLINESIEATRDLSVELSPPVLYDSGLKTTLQWLAGRFEKQNNFKVKVKCEFEDQRIPEHPRELLFNCIHELLLNSVKHSGAEQAEIHLYESTDCVYISVRDEGRGFDVSKIENADLVGFGLFHIIHRLESIGAEINIDSQPDKGTTIQIKYPINMLETASMDTPEVDEKEPILTEISSDKDKIRIILVDDHEVVRTGIRSSLEDYPKFVIVGEAINGEEAINLAGELKPDVMLIDINMPVMDGLHATEIINQRYPSIRIIGLSIYDAASMEKNMLDKGAVAFLPKDANHEKIVNTIYASLNKNDQDGGEE